MAHNIMIVEYQNNISKVMTKHFEKENIDYYIAKNDFNVKKYFLNHSCNLVLLDATLSDKNGTVILNHIRDISDVPVILFAEKHAEKDMLKAFDSGADDYVVKPFRARALMRRIKVMLRRVYDK